MKHRGSNLDLLRNRTPRQFGGMLLKGNAKVARPLSTKHAIHVVLKSHLATGRRSFLSSRNVDRIEALVRAHAKRKGIRIYNFVNVGNHLHLVLKLGASSAIAGRLAFQSFIRSATGLIARHVLGAERNHAKGLKFWQARPFTRLVNWGRDYNRLHRYMDKNKSQSNSGLVDWGFSVIEPDLVAEFDSG